MIYPPFLGEAIWRKCLLLLSDDPSLMSNETPNLIVVLLCEWAVLAFRSLESNTESTFSVYLYDITITTPNIIDILQYLYSFKYFNFFGSKNNNYYKKQFYSINYAVMSYSCIIWNIFIKLNTIFTNRMCENT